MSVYTSVSDPMLRSLLSGYDLGELVDFEGIVDGVDNTNYFVTTERGEFVLTIYENLTCRQVSGYLELMAYLHQHAIRCASPIKNRLGESMAFINNKSAAIIERLPGNWDRTPNKKQISDLGAELGKMHLCLEAYPFVVENRCGAAWRNQTAKQLLPFLNWTDQEFLQQELAYQSSIDTGKLPAGIIHGDVFRDNVLYEQGELSGIIDFYFAGHDCLLFELAVVINDWCLDDDGQMNMQQYDAFLSAYFMHRKINSNEQYAWSAVLRAAALRFWLSRLQDWHQPASGELTFQKKPDKFKKIIQHYRQTEYTLFTG